LGPGIRGNRRGSWPRRCGPRGRDDHVHRFGRQFLHSIQAVLRLQSVIPSSWHKIRVALLMFGGLLGQRGRRAAQLSGLESWPGSGLADVAARIKRTPLALSTDLAKSRTSGVGGDSGRTPAMRPPHGFAVSTRTSPNRAERPLLFRRMGANHCASATPIPVK